MQTESALKIESAKLGAEIRSIESDINRLSTSLDRSDFILESNKQRAIMQAESEFNAEKERQVQRVDSACVNMRDRVEKLLDSFPDLRVKEYAGKYEVQSLEKHLQELYPKEFLDSYVCVDPIEFEDESDAYAVYTSLERRVMRIHRGTLFSTIFSGIVSLMSKVVKDDGVSGKASALALVATVLSFVVSPLLFSTIFTVVGISSFVQGIIIHRILRDLESIKRFLNESYDEDIFQQDKSDILDEVDQFIEGVHSEYVSKINSKQFVMDTSVLKTLEEESRSLKEKTTAAIEGKRQLLAVKQQDLSRLLQNLEELQEAKKKEASAARDKYLSKVEWEYNWLSQILVDVSAENTIITANWPKSNVLYYGQSLDNLQKFCQLAVYQSLIHMPPDYCGQIVLDYKNMGSNLMRMTAVPQSLLFVGKDSDDIKIKTERMQEDIRNRVNNILKSSENIEQFNSMMREYGSVGEAYVIVHVCGLKSFDERLLMALRNGPKVGYFFRIYLTTDELLECKSTIPLGDFGDFYEITDKLVSRTHASVQRILDEGT